MRSAVFFFSFWKRLISILTKRGQLQTLQLCIVLPLPLLLSAANNSLAQTSAQAAQTPDAQSKPSNQLPPVSTMGGSNTGGAHAAVFDAEHRPITAGGSTKTGPVLFNDIARQAGLTAWKHIMGTPEKQFIIETNGSGVGLLDYDNDGWLDIYLVNGSTFEALNGKADAPHAALFHNNHDGTFTAVTMKAGVANDRWGVGVEIGRAS